MTLKGGTSQACAACKYQRRRCTPNCQLAPYFPADQPKMFQNAHRLFGVSNILKILKQLDPSQKMIAMRSIIYQANVRDKYPVYGCLGIIQQLCYQIQEAEEELQSVHSQLNFYKQNPPQEMPNNNNNNSVTTSTLNDSMSQLQLGLMSMSPPNSGRGGGLPFFQDNINNNTINNGDFQYMGSNICYNGINNNNNNNNNNNSNDNCYDVNSSKENNNVMWIQEQHNDRFIHQSSSSSQLITTNLQPQQEQEQEEIEEGGGGGVVVQDYDDMHPFFDTIDDRQSYIDSKEAYESSSESSLKDTTQSMEHVGENELKSAAACFSLTSVN